MLTDVSPVPNLRTDPQKALKQTAKLPTYLESSLGHTDIRFQRLPCPEHRPVRKYLRDVSAQRKLKLKQNPIWLSDLVKVQIQKQQKRMKIKFLTTGHRGQLREVRATDRPL